MKATIFVLNLLIITSCNNETSMCSIHRFGQTVIIDSSELTENLWTYDSKNRLGYFPIYYIGKAVDTIYLGKRKIPRTCYGQKDYSKYKNFTIADSNKMKIIVDTSFSLTYNDYFYHNSERQEKEIIDSTKPYNCYAIFVTNQCDSPIFVGNFSELGYTVRQAKNELGIWVDIETPMRYFCGTGARKIVIEPNELIVALLPRYKGDYKTECRLRFMDWKYSIYSNVFTDYIDKKQLTDSLETYYN